MDDEFGDDGDFNEALELLEQQQPATANARRTSGVEKEKETPAPGNKGVQQLKPQVVTSSSSSAILVSTRQRGNPLLKHLRGQAWEYCTDTPADYVVGTTTCALFLSLKYHRLHPEYLSARTTALGQKYLLRILLALVDIGDHEAAVRELTTTSLHHNLTLILAWSAPEAARYLELFKSCEHAAPTAIRAPPGRGFSEQATDFLTAPRGINKTDAVGILAACGSVRAAVNARPEELALLAGWGEKKVQRWCASVREGFRVGRAGGVKKKLPRAGAMPPSAGGGGGTVAGAGEEEEEDAEEEEEEEALLQALALAEQDAAAAAAAAGRRDDTSPGGGRGGEAEVSAGVASALAKLRSQA